MRQDINSRILEVYFENPEKEFTIREISKITKIPRATVHRKLTELKRERYFVDNLLFKMKKVNFYTEKIFTSELIDYLLKTLNPSCIILFGSIRKGESDKTSDIDIFVESSVKKSLDLSKFEKKIGHKIDLFIESDLKNLNSNLFNNVINGIKLYGSFKIK